MAVPMPRGRRRLRLGAAGAGLGALLGLLLVLLGAGLVGGSLPPMGPSAGFGAPAAAAGADGGGGQPPLPPGWVIYYHEGRAYVSGHSLMGLLVHERLYLYCT